MLSYIRKIKSGMSVYFEGSLIQQRERKDVNEELKDNNITLKISVPQRQERLHKLLNMCFEG